MNIEVIKFNTAKNLELHGLYLGKKNPPVLYIFIHGLASSVFKKYALYQPLVTKNSAVLAFNNRGSEIISRFKKRSSKEAKIIGMAHEKFTDCLDDINGAINFAKKFKPKKIILLGHSTGCQKIIYYLAKNNNTRKVKGVVLLSPISDSAGISNFFDKKQIKKALNYAKKLVNNKKSHQLLSQKIWPHYIDAQRFISLYSKNSSEEIFSYAQKNKKSKFLRKVNLPLYIFIGKDDVFLDRDANVLKIWFKNELKTKKYKIELITGADHSFKNLEKILARKIINYF